MNANENQSSAGTSMKLAAVVLMDESGAYVWEGTLTQFFRDNAMDRDQRREIVRGLRPRADMPEFSEPVFIGGGAAPEFALLLSSDKTSNQE
jgi:hypothetical protein